jgi:hypothetical protein
MSANPFGSATVSVNVWAAPLPAFGLTDTAVGGWLTTVVVNVAVTVRACVIATVHVVPLALVHPVHAPNWYPLAGTAVSVTFPVNPASLQSPVPPVPQLIPVPVIRPFVGVGEMVSV